MIITTYGTGCDAAIDAKCMQWHKPDTRHIKKQLIWKQSSLRVAAWSVWPFFRPVVKVSWYSANAHRESSVWHTLELNSNKIVGECNVLATYLNNIIQTQQGRRWVSVLQAGDVRCAQLKNRAPRSYRYRASIINCADICSQLRSEVAGMCC